MRILSNKSEEHYGWWQVLVDHTEAVIQKHNILLYLREIYIVGKVYQVEFELVPGHEEMIQLDSGATYWKYIPDPKIPDAQPYMVFLQDDSIIRMPHPRYFKNAIS
jgi:phenylalanine-4-hydroxylase